MIKPLQSRILVLPDAKSSSSNIIIPGEQEKSTTGVVVRLGTDTYDSEGKLEEKTVSVGDRIAYHPSSASLTHMVDGKEMVIMYEVDIYAVID